MNHRVSSAPPPAYDAPESAVDELAVTLADEDGGGDEGGRVDRGAGAGALVPGVAVESGGGGGGGRFGGCPVSMAKHGVTVARLATPSATRNVPPLRTARGFSPI
jgi:hypothetical protein